MEKCLYLFRIVYLILLLFVLANFFRILWLRIYATSLESLAVSWSSYGY